jgi:hypothetical protein
MDVMAREKTDQLEKPADFILQKDAELTNEPVPEAMRANVSPSPFFRQAWPRQNE